VPSHWIEPFSRLAGELDLPVADAQGGMARVQAFVERIMSALARLTAENERRDARCGPALQPGALFEAVVATIADDDVVEDLHAEQRAGIKEATRQLDVVRAGARIAGGMVMRLMFPKSLCGGVSARAPMLAVRRSREGT